MNIFGLKLVFLSESEHLEVLTTSILKSNVKHHLLTVLSFLITQISFELYMSNGESYICIAWNSL